MKHRVPAAPQPACSDASFTASEFSFARQRAGRSARSSSRPAPLQALDASFLSRTAVVTLCFGALLAVCVGGATHSFIAATSFAAGALLSVGLLKSQQWFVSRLVAMRVKRADSYRGWDAHFPLWLLVALKYIGVTAAIGFALKTRVLIPEAFAAGFTLLQVMVFARVAGRLIKANLRPIEQVYIRNAKTP